MLKKINDIFRLKGIFDFSHLQFDGVRAQTDGSGMEGTKKLEQWRWRPLNFSRSTQDIAIFFNGTQGIPPISISRTKIPMDNLCINVLNNIGKMTSVE